MYTEYQLLNKLNAARTAAISWASTIIQAYYYITPDRNALSEFYQYINPTAPRTYAIYDVTAPNAAKLRSQQLMGMLLPPRERLATMSLNPRYSTPVTKDMLQEIEDFIYFHLYKSNINSVVQEAFLDMTVSSGAIWRKPGDVSKGEPMWTYKAIPGFTVMPEFYFGSVVVDHWIPSSISGNALLKEYPEMDPNLKRQVEDLYHAKPDTRFYITTGHLLDPDPADPTKKWRIVTMFDKSRSPDLANLSDEYISSFWSEDPLLMYLRENVQPGSALGCGPGLLNVQIIDKLNDTVKRFKSGVDLRCEPVAEFDQRKVNITRPGSLIGGRSVPMGSIGKVWELPPNPEVEWWINLIRQDIRDSFAIKPIGDMSDATKSATEINTRVNESNYLVSISANRMIDDTSKPVFTGYLNRGMRLNILPHNDIFQKEYLKNPDFIIISYRNPLADIQNNNDVIALERVLQSYQTFWGGPSILAAINPDEYQEFVTKTSGIDKKLFTSGAAFKSAILSGLKAQANQEQQAQNAQNFQAMGGSPTPTPTAAQPPSLSLAGANL